MVDQNRQTEKKEEHAQGKTMENSTQAALLAAISQMCKTFTEWFKAASGEYE